MTDGLKTAKKIVDMFEDAGMEKFHILSDETTDTDIIYSNDKIMVEVWCSTKKIELIGQIAKNAKGGRRESV